MYKELKEYLSSVRNFSGSVLVARNGEIILKEGYGYADRSRGTKNTPGMNFGIGSVTKSMTALSIMRLVEKTQIDLTCTVDDIFPDVFSGKGISIHNLLSQTSGISNDFSHEDIRNSTDRTSEEIVRMMSEKPLKYKPGEKWTYSNTNYMLLALIIQKVSGMPYHDYIREFIFKPAGMASSCFDGENCGNMALHGKGSFDCRPSMMLGAGDVVSNVEDLFLYDQALYTDVLVSGESIRKTQEAVYNGKMVKYGYGWFIHRYFGRKSVSHGGFHPIGYTSHLERYTDERLTIIVLSNELEKYSLTGVRYFGSTDVARALAAICFGGRVMPWQKLV